MNIDKFFEVLNLEMEQNEAIKKYYRFYQKPGFFKLRKAYFYQRMDYLLKHIDKKDGIVWDCGCGYGSLGIFMALNGIRVHGTTIGKHYISQVETRKKFWSQYGDTSLFTVAAESLFDNPPQPETYDYVIVQDTLHHLEPIQDALYILKNSLKDGGKIIALEANGGNLFHKINLYKYRQNKRVIEIYDEELKKKVLYGNENYRSIQEWQKELDKHNLKVAPNVQHIKFFLPFMYKLLELPAVIKLEQAIARKSDFLKQNFYFGVNFIVTKN